MVSAGKIYPSILFYAGCRVIVSTIIWKKETVSTVSDGYFIILKLWVLNRLSGVAAVKKKPVRLAEMTLDIKLWQKSNDLPFPAASLNNGVLKSVSTTRQVPDNFRTWYNSGKSWFRQHREIGLRPHDFIKLSFCFCHNISLNHKNSRAKISPRSMPADSGKLGTASRFWAFVGVQSATSKCENCTLGINGKIRHRHFVFTVWSDI